MAKYDEVYQQTFNMKPSEIIKTYDLTKLQIALMQHLYQEQLKKENVIEDFYRYTDSVIPYTTNKLISQQLGDLKRKGLIYSVVGVRGYLGTEIRV